MKDEDEESEKLERRSIAGSRNKNWGKKRREKNHGKKKEKREKTRG
jgi:hypothetical protein